MPSAVRRPREPGGPITRASHRLNEVRRLADRIAVLRDGRLVAGLPAGEVSEQEPVRLMVGRRLTLVPGRPEPAGDRPWTATRGETAATAGLAGAGRTELAEALFGAVPSTGRVQLDGIPVHPAGPRAALVAQGCLLVVAVMIQEYRGGWRGQPRYSGTGRPA